MIFGFFFKPLFLALEGKKAPLPLYQHSVTRESRDLNWTLAIEHLKSYHLSIDENIQREAKQGTPTAILKIIRMLYDSVISNSFKHSVDSTEA